MDFVFPPDPVVTVPIAGEAAQFPVRRIYCVGRNYAAHVREMGFDPDRAAPFFFQKPRDAIMVSPGTLPYPPLTSDFHHEVELVLAIGRAGSNIEPEQALDHVYGYAVGLDMTRRDLQAAARKQGNPWEIGKASDHSAPIGALHPAARIGHLKQGRIWLAVNGAIRQESDINQMIWSPSEIVSILSRAFTLFPGDLIYSGTPEGVAAVQSGDVIAGGISGLTDIDIRIG